MKTGHQGISQIHPLLMLAIAFGLLLTVAVSPLTPHSPDGPEAIPAHVEHENGFGNG